LISIVPIDLEDNQRGTILEWLISKGIKDPDFSERFVQANNTKQLVAVQRNAVEVLGRWVPGWKRNFERFYHYQDFMEEKDLFALDTFNDLLDIIERADEKIEAYQEKKDYHDADEGTEVFRDDDEWRIYALHNKGAACHFGKNTEWCTAAPGLDYFESYYRPDDPLFYFEHEPTNEDQFFAPNERWQFHYGSEQFMDENDRELSPGEAFKFHKLLMQTDAPEKYPVVSQYLDTIKQREDAMKRWRVPPMVPLMENWRKYLLKEELVVPVIDSSNLVIYDFDETIASSVGFIVTTHKETGDVGKITTQKEYDALLATGEYDFDFDNLNQVTDPTEITPITKHLRRDVGSSGIQVMILTARQQTAEDEIQGYLQSIDIDPSEIIIIGCAGCDKGKYVAQMVAKSPNVRNIVFYDDSKTNIQDLVSAKESLKGNLDSFDIVDVSDPKNWRKY